MLQTKQSNFINNEIWILTFGGAFQRSGVYTNDVPDAKKGKFRAAIKKRVNQLGHDRYTGSVPSGDVHISLLIELKNWIDHLYSKILANGEIRFGIIQKLVNLHLKYLWCLNIIPCPPHCPFDGIVISKMGLRNPPYWTKMNSIETYKMLVDRAKELAGERSISEWELDIFAQ